MKRVVAIAIAGLAFSAQGEGNPSKGREVVMAKGDGNCLLCHAIPGADRPAGNIGPSLADVGAKMSEAEIRRRIADPAQFNPDTVMPPYGSTEGLHAVAPQYRGKPLLSARDIEDAAAFLATLK